MKLDNVADREIANLNSARNKLIAQLKRQGIQNVEVLEAINAVPRERFVGKTLAHRSYENVPLPIGYRQTISQPYIVALMSDRLISKSFRRDTVLEIGTGSGYQAAVLSKLYEKVYTVERIKHLNLRARNMLYSLNIQNVELRYGDGCEGWAGIANFDSIIVTAGTDRIPHALLGQMIPGSYLLAPIGGAVCRLISVTKNQDGSFTEEAGESVRFVPLLEGKTE